MSEDGYPILFDGHHLTKPGAQHVGMLGRPEILRLLGAASPAAL